MIESYHFPIRIDHGQDHAVGFFEDLLASAEVLQTTTDSTLQFFRAGGGHNDQVRRSSDRRLTREDGRNAVASTALTNFFVQTGWVFGQGFLVGVDQILTQQQVTNEFELTSTPCVEAFFDRDVLAANA
ncbi:hypothetical protein D3C71_1765610 [compost metagenome]